MLCCWEEVEVRGETLLHGRQGMDTTAVEEASEIADQAFSKSGASRRGE